MLVIGLTGGIATGKSTVSTLLRAHNLPIIDADVLARDVVRPGTPALARIVRTFGPAILRADGTLDRAALGARVFADPAQRAALNAIVHPAVRRAMLLGVLRCWIRGAPICILDVPLLIEGGLWKFVASVVVVYCSPQLQLQRLTQRDASEVDAAAARIAAQLPIEAKLAYADVVLDNSGDRRELSRQVDALVLRWRAAAGWSWRISWLFPPWALLSAAWTLAWRAWRHAGRVRREQEREGRRIRDRAATGQAS